MVIYGEKRAISYPGYVVYKIYDKTKVIRNWGLRPINTRFYGKKTK